MKGFFHNRLVDSSHRPSVFTQSELLQQCVDTDAWCCCYCDDRSAGKSNTIIGGSCASVKPQPVVGDDAKMRIAVCCATKWDCLNFVVFAGVYVKLGWRSMGLMPVFFYRYLKSVNIFYDAMVSQYKL
jgi:hypothetical protein